MRRNSEHTVVPSWKRLAILITIAWISTLIIVLAAWVSMEP